jgi:methyltransferase-like protein
MAHEDSATIDRNNPVRQDCVLASLPGHRFCIKETSMHFITNRQARTSRLLMECVPAIRYF